jgi:hypothetical protein
VQQALDESGLNVNGTGIKVGVLSDSFNDLGGAAADEADGALPSASNIQVLKDLGSGGADEGRAMMQIVHDIAPGASLAFYTAFESEQDFANGILALVSSCSGTSPTARQPRIWRLSFSAMEASTKSLRTKAPARNCTIRWSTCSFPREPIRLPSRICPALIPA